MRREGKGEAAVQTPIQGGGNEPFFEIIKGALAGSHCRRFHLRTATPAIRADLESSPDGARSLGNRLIRAGPELEQSGQIQNRERLGGLLNYYHRAA
ncbi:MAG: hypothetical protein ACI9HK_006052 [Pirellulaceae bacterium]